jgi:plasmid maintenance system antidote protein VapI
LLVIHFFFTLNSYNEIIHGKAAVVPETALQLERVFGVPQEYWLNHEAKYRASLPRQNEEAHHEAPSPLPGN